MSPGFVDWKADELLAILSSIEAQEYFPSIISALLIHRKSLIIVRNNSLKLNCFFLLPEHFLSLLNQLKSICAAENISLEKLLEVPSSSGATFSHVAAAFSAPEAIEFIIKHAPKTIGRRITYSETNTNEADEIYIAMHNGYMNIVYLLLNHFEKSGNLSEVVGDRAADILCTAAYNVYQGSRNVIEFLWNRKLVADIDAPGRIPKEEEGHPALSWVVKGLNHVSDYNSDEYGNRHRDCIKYFLEQGASPHYKLNTYTYPTLLHMVAIDSNLNGFRRYHAAIIAAFIFAGVDRKVVNRFGITPMDVSPKLSDAIESAEATRNQLMSTPIFYYTILTAIQSAYSHQPESFSYKQATSLLERDVTGLTS
jgi:hypothetical protein